MFDALIVDLPIDEFRKSSKSTGILRLSLEGRTPAFVHDDLYLGASLPVFLYQDPH